MSTMIRRKRSYLWEYFSITDPSNRIAQCDICDRRLRFQSTATNLRKHLERKHPTILSVRSVSEAAVSSVSVGVGDDVDEQNNQQAVYAATDIVDYESHEPVAYTVEIQNAKDTTNEAGATMFVVTDNGTMPSVSHSPDPLSSMDTKREWQETKNAEPPMAQRNVCVVADNGTMPSASPSTTSLSSVSTKKDWQETRNDEPPVAPRNVFVVTDNGRMSSVSPSSAALSSIRTKREWRERKNDEPPVAPCKQLPSSSKENDEFDLFGMSIAAKMRKMSRTDNVQCIIAEKLISEVLYRGQLQFLTFDTVVKVSEKH
ncbi:uncharacterized protein LOC126092030 [Schistocerca cancellata]|uniref:uncharacterized protein LOC126092030 n=1 Tax=Schistocerca cancellata TaxID=274614 RepID=UPI00211981C4|nr:uncharacterized protein LOC126092030 [Schistocerca cancellata]